MTPSSDMPEKVSAERLREIVDGCEGVTPGPWETQTDGFRATLVRVAKEAGRKIATAFASQPPKVKRRDKESREVFEQRSRLAYAASADQNERNAAHIARLDPATVRSIGLELIEARAGIDTLREKIEHKAEAAQISRSVEEHNLRRALAAERDRDEAAALIDTLQRERNKLVLSVGEHVTKRSEYLARAEAAEAEVTRLREALEPFAEHDTGAVEAVGIFSIPDEHPLLGTGLGNDWRPSITVGDFRRARSALSKDTP